MDFDTLSPSKLDNYDYAITTSAAYASTAPSNWSEIAREGDYVLWERSGPTPRLRIIEKGGYPGENLECPSGSDSGATATILAPPATAEQTQWEPSASFDAPGSASADAEPPAGEWDLSLQYHSQAPLTVSVDGAEVATLPPSLEGFYLTGAGRGAFWPAGEVTTSGGPVEIEVAAAEPSALQRALGVERTTWLGTVALTSQDEPETKELATACDEYVDHYEIER
jgi:hypothetical protein